MTFTRGPPTPLRSFPDLVSLTQSIREQPGARATLFLGFPVAELEPKQPNAKKKICKELEVRGG